jgi:hypothetical protein
MAHLLERLPVGLFEVTLFEATARLGGKILTQRFDTIPAIYEAGVAELYDYSNIGLDPLKTLVQQLGLKTIPIHGYAVVLGDEILRSDRVVDNRRGELQSWRRYRRRSNTGSPSPSQAAASPSNPMLNFLRATDGRSNGRRVSSFMTGVALLNRSVIRSRNEKHESNCGFPLHPSLVPVFG